MWKLPPISTRQILRAALETVTSKTGLAFYGIVGFVLYGATVGDDSSSSRKIHLQTQDHHFSDILTDDFMRRVSLAESSGGKYNVNPRNPKVLGPFQIHEQTFMGTLYQEKHNIGYDMAHHIAYNSKKHYHAPPEIQKAILNARMDFNLSATVAKIGMATDLASIAQKAPALLQDFKKRSDWEGAAYAMHHFGRSGGERFLSTLATKPETPFASITTRDVCNKNRDICYDGNNAARSVEDVFGLLQKKLGWRALIVS